MNSKHAVLLVGHPDDQLSWLSTQCHALGLHPVPVESYGKALGSSSGRWGELNR